MSEGVGLPDHFVPSMPARMIIVTGQATYAATASGSVNATSSANVHTYEVAANRRLYMLYVSVSTTHSCIQRFQLLKDATVFEDIWFDVHGHVSYPDTAAYTLEAGETLYIKCYNNDSSARTFYVTIMGWLQTVG